MSQRPEGGTARSSRKSESRDALLARLSRLESSLEEERARTQRVMRGVERAKRSSGEAGSRASTASRSSRPPTEPRGQSRAETRDSSREERGTGPGDGEERYFGRRLSDVTRLERDLRLTSVRPTALFATVAKTGGKVNMSRRQTDVTLHHARWKLNKPAPPSPDHDTKCFRHVRDDITRDAEEIERSRVRR